MPESRVRADEQLHRHRRRAAPARAPRGLRGRGVVGRQARGARLRRGPRRPRARRPSRPTATRPSRTPGSSGRTSSATPRRSSASRRSSSSTTFMQPTWQALDRRRALLRAAAARDHRAAAGRTSIVEDNVVAFPALTDRRRAVRADRVVQPAGGPGAGRPAGVLRAARRRPLASGPRSAPSTTAPTARCGRRSTRGCVEQGAPPLPDLEFIHDARARQPLRLPGGRRLHRRAGRSTPTWHRLDSVGARRPTQPFELPAARRPARRQRAGLPVARLARQSPTSS